MEWVFLCGSGSVAEVPEELSGVADALRGVLELKREWRANRVGNVEIGHDGGKVEVKLDDADVAVGTIVHLRPCAWSGGEIIVAAAARTYRLINPPVIIESAGAAVHVFTCIRTAEIGRIHQLRSIIADTYKIVIVVVGRHLESVAGDGEAGRSAQAAVGDGTSPARHIDVVAQIH